MVNAISKSFVLNCEKGGGCLLIRKKKTHGKTVKIENWMKH